MGRYISLLLFIGLAWGQDDTSNQISKDDNLIDYPEITYEEFGILRIREIEEMAIKNCEIDRKTLTKSSFVKIPKIFCLGTVAGLAVASRIYVDSIFMGMLIGGTVYPIHQYKKQKLRDIKYPKTIMANERLIYTNAYIEHLNNPINKGFDKNILTHAGIGCLGFVAIMHVLMNIGPIAG